jgi:transposase
MISVPNLKNLTHEQKDALIIDLVRRLNEIEARLEKDSHNSSKPPSSDGLKRKPKPKSQRTVSGAAPGAQPGHEGKTLKRVAHPDHIEIHRVSRVCDICGQEITDDRVSLLAEERQVIDLPAIRFEVTAHRLERAQCSCGEVHCAKFPESLSQAVQYGNQIQAAAVYLTQYQQLPLERSSQALRDLFGLSLSAGTVQNCITQAARILSPAVEIIGRALQSAPVVHFDETGMRVGRTLHWLHTASTQALTWYGSHRTRGREALDSFGILPLFEGVAVHDGWVPYTYYDCEHALCNAHHVRELIGVWESTQQPWAERMIELLRQAKREVDASIVSGHTGLNRTRTRYYQRRNRALIREGRKLNPQQARDPTREDVRGRIKQSEAYNLLGRLERHAKQVWRFVVDHRVPFDNNQAERDIRMPKLKQKVSGCFRTASGLQAFCTIRSYLATLRKQRRALLDALALSFAGNVPWPLGAD